MPKKIVGRKPGIEYVVIVGVPYKLWAAIIELEGVWHPRLKEWLVPEEKALEAVQLGEDNGYEFTVLPIARQGDRTKGSIVTKLAELRNKE